MSILTSARQYALRAVVNYTQAELPTAVGVPVLVLPQGAIVTSIMNVIDTAFNSVTSDTLDVGDVTAADRYISNDDAKAAGATAGVATGFATTATETTLVITNTAVGTEGTLGVGRLVVEYIVTGRHNENQD
jgi:hypothetical protein